MSEWVVWVPVALLTLGFGWLAVALLRDRAQGREQLAANRALTQSRIARGIERPCKNASTRAAMARASMEGSLQRGPRARLELW